MFLNYTGAQLIIYSRTTTHIQHTRERYTVIQLDRFHFGLIGFPVLISTSMLLKNNHSQLTLKYVHTAGKSLSSDNEGPGRGSLL